MIGDKVNQCRRNQRLYGMIEKQQFDLKKVTPTPKRNYEKYKTGNDWYLASWLVQMFSIMCICRKVNFLLLDLELINDK